MKIPNIVSYQQANGILRTLVVALVLALVVVMVYFNYTNLQLQERLSERIYFLDENGAAYSAKEITGYGENERLSEYIAHVENFYRLFYSFDDQTFDGNMKRALELIDNSVDPHYEDYFRTNIKEDLYNDGLELKVSIENIEIDMRTRMGIIEGIQETVIGNVSAYRRLYARFTIRDKKVRTTMNPHKAIIGNWEIYDSQEVELQ